MAKPRFGQTFGETGRIEEGNAAHTDAVRSLGVEGEKELADEWIEHGSRFYRIAARMRAYGDH